MRKLSILGLDVSDWYGPWMCRQQILSRMALNHSVGYSRGAFFSWDRFTPAWMNAPLFSYFETDNCVAVHRRPKWPLRLPNYPRVDRYTLRRIGRSLRTMVRGSDSGLLVAYVFHPSLLPVAEALNADLLVYHAYDQFSAYPGVRERDVALERELVARADIVIGVSKLIAENLRAYSNRDVAIVSNAVDFDLFARSNEKIPPDLREIPGPRIAYFGNLTEKVDIALIGRLARLKPEWSFIMVGGMRLVSDESRATLSQIVSLPNVFCLGHQDYEKVPAYMRATDVNILTYRVGEGLWSEACSPLKLYEYLAVGKPVVSNELDVIEPHRDVIAIARTDEEWIRAIDDALRYGGQGSVDTRQKVAKENTWEARIVQIEALLHESLQGVE